MALEKSLQSEEALRQQLQQTEHQWQQAHLEYQAQQQQNEVEIQRLRDENDKLVKEKDRITQEHIQESYLTNLNLHRRTVELEQALQKTEALLRERTQQVHELEEIPKIPVSPDDQLETEHRLILEASSNIVSLALESRSVDQTLTLYYNALTEIGRAHV